MDVSIKTWGEGQILLTVFVTFDICLSCLALHPGLAVKNILINTLCNRYYFNYAKQSCSVFM